jgi:DNA modification methylase
VNWPDDYINKIICGDCLSIMQGIPDGERLSIVTDPIWPNCVNLFNVDNPHDLLESALNIADKYVKRVVIHLGLDSDPRFLTAVPSRLKFIRSFSLRYARPHFKGRIMYDRDVAYLFGECPRPRPNERILNDGPMMSDTVTSDSKGKVGGHPCPRKLDHVRWLIRRLTDDFDIILDPFAGSGTTCVAAKQLGRKYIGIEINPDYCKIAEDRLRQEELF